MTGPMVGVTNTRWGRWEFLWGERTYVMGIVNVTDDSFSGDGLGYDTEAAVAQGKRLVEWGADILDIGGESSRPLISARVEAAVSGGSECAAGTVSLEEELKRVIPVIEQLNSQVQVPISVDTTKVVVAREAVRVGAAMINDVWGLKTEPELAEVAATARIPIVLNHNQKVVVADGDIVDSVIESLQWSCSEALRAGVPVQHIILDPGFGFGKTPEQNLEIVRRLGELRQLGQPLLLGTSRKSTIGHVLGLPVKERLEGTAATLAIAIANGVDILRVHDVREMVRVVKMADAVMRGWRQHP